MDLLGGDWHGLSNPTEKFRSAVCYLQWLCDEGWKWIQTDNNRHITPIAEGVVDVGRLRSNTDSSLVHEEGLGLNTQDVHIQSKIKILICCDAFSIFYSVSGVKTFQCTNFSFGSQHKFAGSIFPLKQHITFRRLVTSL